MEPTIIGDLPFGIPEAHEDRGRHFSVVEIAAAMSVGGLALLILAWQPILLGALTQQKVITEALLGQIAMLETLALACASAVSPTLLRRGGLKPKVIAATLALVVVDVATGRATDAVGVLALRGVAGVLEGVLMGATILVLIESAQAERLNALFLAVSAIPQAAGAFLLPTLVIPGGGARGAFDVLAASAAATLLAVPFLASIRRRVEQGVPRPTLKWNLRLTAAMFAIFAQNAGFGSAWNYIERLAHQRGFSDAAVAAAIGGNVVCQVIGAFCIAWIGVRMPLRISLVSITVIQTLLVCLIGASDRTGIYVAGLLLFGLLWLTVNSFQVRMLIELDQTRTVAGWVVAVVLLGQSAGPLIGSLTVDPGNVLPAFAAAVILMSLAAVAYVAAAQGRGRPESTAQPA